MQLDLNILRRHDLGSITEIENALQDGPLAEMMQRAPSIERRRLTKEQFDEEYRKQNRPVILEGLIDHWPARNTWSFEYLADRCGTARVTVNSYTSKKASEITFGKFVELLHENPTTSPLYLQEWYYLADCPWLANDLPELEITQYDCRNHLYALASSANNQLWIGQKGSVTRLHQDSYMVDVIHMQIIGKKNWYVMGPKTQLHYNDQGKIDINSFRHDKNTQLMQCVLQPGEVLYLPAQWFHRIELLSNSVGVGRKCLDEVNLQMHIRLRMAELLALTLNREEIRQTHPELFDVVLSRNRAWAQRMNIDLSKLRP